jgi:hypothetical protein
MDSRESSGGAGGVDLRIVHQVGAIWIDLTKDVRMTPGGYLGTLLDGIAGLASHVCMR